MQFDLLLFSTDPAFIRDAVAAGVGGIIVDWEHLGKEARQACANTQINHDTLDDLRRVRACTSARVICRINNHDAIRAREVEQAIAAGADELLLPMVRTVEEVVAVLDQAAGRCGVGILVETVAAVELAAALGRLPLARVYVGLNDLAIDRGAHGIFTALADGTVERVRQHFHVPFGFGGLTLPDRGAPIPCQWLISEMARLRCAFSFLRRSFHADIRGRDMGAEIPRIQAALEATSRRPREALARDQAALQALIAALEARREVLR